MPVTDPTHVGVFDFKKLDCCNYTYCLWVVVATNIQNRLSNEI